MTETNNRSGAGRVNQPNPLPPPPAPSFARRHPFYAAFGVLAALSLFSAFWPLSALVTGAVVLGRATGLDRLALRGAGRAAQWLRERVSRRPEQPPPEPAPPTAEVQRAPEILARGAVERGPAVDAPTPRTRHHHVNRARRPVAAGIREPDDRSLGA